MLMARKTLNHDMDYMILTGGEAAQRQVGERPSEPAPLRRMLCLMFIREGPRGEEGAGLMLDPDAPAEGSAEPGAGASGPTG